MYTHWGFHQFFICFAFFLGFERLSTQPSTAADQIRFVFASQIRSGQSRANAVVDTKTAPAAISP